MKNLVLIIVLFVSLAGNGWLVWQRQSDASQLARLTKRDDEAMKQDVKHRDKIEQLEAQIAAVNDVIDKKFSEYAAEQSREKALLRSSMNRISEAAKRTTDAQANYITQLENDIARYRGMVR